MTLLDDHEQALRIELMETQIDHARLDLDKIRQDLRWEPWKALAAILSAAAAIAGVAGAGALWLSHYVGH